MGYAERNNPNASINVSESVRRSRFAKRDASDRRDYREAMSRTAVPVAFGAAAGFMAFIAHAFAGRVSKYAGGWGRKPMLSQKVIG